LLRLKQRRDRRPGFPIEPAWIFYPKYFWNLASKSVRVAKHWIDLELITRRARREQALRPYMDLALTPVTDDETETLELFTHNEAARSDVVHQRKIAALTHGAARPDAAQHA
jgi:hypothetical protein